MSDHKPTPLPWELGNHERIVSKSTGVTVAQCLWDADARYILEAISERDQLRGQVSELLGRVAKSEDRAEQLQRRLDAEHARVR